MGLNRGVTLLFANDGGVSITVNHNTLVRNKKYLNQEDAIGDAVEARLIASDVAMALLEDRRGCVGIPLQYRPPALQDCGFTEFPVLD